jgi:hypothetical protein
MPFSWEKQLLPGMPDRMQNDNSDAAASFHRRNKFEPMAPQKPDAADARTKSGRDELRVDADRAFL